MTLEEFVKKHKIELIAFEKMWFAQVKNADLDFPDWMDYFWGWCEQKWDKEDEE